MHGSTKLKYHSILYHRSFSKSAYVIEGWIAEANRLYILAGRSWPYAFPVKIPNVQNFIKTAASLLHPPLPNLWVECDWWVSWTMLTALGCRILHNTLTYSSTIYLREWLVHTKIYFMLRNDKSLFVFAWKYCQDRKTHFRVTSNTTVFLVLKHRALSRVTVVLWVVSCAGATIRNKFSPFYFMHTSNVSYITWRLNS